MIIVVKGTERHRYPELIESMFRMRAAVFSDRLDWDVAVVDGLETDRFDETSPLYLLSVDPATRTLQGSVRLLQTTGPNMLRDVFPVLVPDGAPQSPHIWESSRFAVNPASRNAADRASGGQRVGQTTLELLCGIVEVCMAAAVPHVVSVFDARMARIFRSVECRFEVIGTPTRIGKVMCFAGLFEASAAMRHRLGKAGELYGPVVAATDNANPFAP